MPDLKLWLFWRFYRDFRLTLLIPMEIEGSFVPFSLGIYDSHTTLRRKNQSQSGSKGEEWPSRPSRTRAVTRVRLSAFVRASHCTATPTSLRKRRLSCPPSPPNIHSSFRSRHRPHTP